MALDTPATVSETCATDSDVYYAHSIVFDSGFETAYVSANSTRVQCGPTVANPNSFKLIDKKPKKNE